MVLILRSVSLAEPIAVTVAAGRSLLASTPAAPSAGESALTVVSGALPLRSWPLTAHLPGARCTASSTFGPPTTAMGGSGTGAEVWSRAGGSATAESCAIDVGSGVEVLLSSLTNEQPLSVATASEPSTAREVRRERMRRRVGELA